MNSKFADYYEKNPNKFDLKKTGDRIKSLRKDRKKYTQIKLAEKIFKTESSIRKYEKGLVVIPMNVLIDIANALDTTVYYLLCLDESGVDNISTLVKDYDIPPWEILGLKDSRTFLEQLDNPDLYREYEEKLGKDNIEMYKKIAYAKKVMNELREDNRQSFINKFKILLSLVGFELKEKSSGNFELSTSDDVSNTIIITWEELYALAEDILDYNKYKVEKFFERLNDDEHKPPEGDVFFHV